MKLVVGLGNPGKQYVGTRHNIGFLVVEAFAIARQVRLSPLGQEALAGSGSIAGEDVWVAEPLGYMNRSGRAVRFLLTEIGGGPDALVVVHDDLDLPLGQLRFKRKGGHGGHNGVRSIIEALGTDVFLRLKIGVGRPPAGRDPVDYVLEAFAPDERQVVEAAIERGKLALETALTDGVSVAMNRFHAA